MLKNRRPINIFERKLLSDRWALIFDQYVKRFGFSQMFLDMMEKKKQIALLKIQRMETGDNSLQLFIDISTQELEFMQKRIEKGEEMTHETKVTIEKILGFRLDPMSVSTEEFYSYIESLRKKKPKSNV